MVNFRPIYGYRTFPIASFVGLGDNVIGQKKTIDTEKRKRIKSEKIEIYDYKKNKLTGLRYLDVNGVVT